jgi:nitrogenase subunit NifH
MSLYTANGILKTLAGNGSAPKPLSADFIANGLSNPFEESFVSDFARTLHLLPF